MYDLYSIGELNAGSKYAIWNKNDELYWNTKRVWGLNLKVAPGSSLLSLGWKIT